MVTSPSSEYPSASPSKRDAAARPQAVQRRPVPFGAASPSERLSRKELPISGSRSLKVRAPAVPPGHSWRSQPLWPSASNCAAAGLPFAAPLRVPPRGKGRPPSVTRKSLDPLSRSAMASVTWPATVRPNRASQARARVSAAALVCGGASSSRIASAMSSGANMSDVPFTVPETVTFAFPPFASLSTAAIVTFAGARHGVCGEVQNRVRTHFDSVRRRDRHDHRERGPPGPPAPSPSPWVFPPFSPISAGLSASLTRGLVSFRRFILLMR